MRKLFKRNFIIGALAVVFLLEALFLGIYFFSKKIPKENALNSSLKDINLSKQDLAPKEKEVSTNEPADTITEVIKKGSVKWQEPVDVGDMGLTSKKIYEGCHDTSCGEDGVESNGIKYIKAGEVLDGKYQGYEFLVIVSGVSEGPGIAPDLFRILKKGDDVIFIANPSYGFDTYVKDFVTNIFSDGSGKKEFENIQVEDLDYPDELYGLSDRQRFEKDPYAKAFFTDAKLKKAFVNPKYGQVWMTDETKVDKEKPTQFELNSYLDYQGKKSYYDIFDRYGFFMKAPDGTAVAYKMKLDIFDKFERTGVLEATWSDGTKNKGTFEENPGGCGSGDYVYDETTTVNPATDLAVVGKTDKGDDIFGYKNTDSIGFQYLYNKIYWVAEGQKKKDTAEFLKTHPKVFWKDHFGRILSFYSTDIISPAECGKPVIYLYPKNDQDVHVEVSPGNGLSYSDPEYRSGWDVLAHKNGDLINFQDGKKYPFLFWEGAGNVYYEMPKEGFVISQGRLDSFFNDKLSRLGLIPKEINDFKDFWISKMKEDQKPYYFITFLSKRYIDTLAPLKIDPVPDSIIRVMMDYKGLDQYEKVPGLSIKTPERKGFAAVEWGGMLK